MQSHKLFLNAALVACVLALSGCSSSGKIRSDYDRTADFGQYRTYNFYSDAGPEDTNYQSLFSQYMTTAIEREMDARGYEKSDDPDLLVNFNARLQDKTKVTSSPAPMYGGYGYYGYRRGFYDPWMGYGYATETHVSQYTEGTVNIDLVDARQKKLVWESVGIGRVRDDTFENLEQRVNEAVPRFFELFPFRAGDGNPAN
jgi:hypothetical protein